MRCTNIAKDSGIVCVLRDVAARVFRTRNAKMLFPIPAMYAIVQGHGLEDERVAPLAPRPAGPSNPRPNCALLCGAPIVHPNPQ